MEIGLTIVVLLLLGGLIYSTYRMFRDDEFPNWIG